MRAFHATGFPTTHANARADADFEVARGVPRMRDLRMALLVRRHLRTVLP
jgi:hypothetical protein